MMRCVGLLMILGLVAGAGLAQDTYTIKLKESGTGDVVEIAEQSTEDSKAVLLDAGGKQVFEKKELKVKDMAYRETVLEKPKGADRPTQLRRDYTKAETKTDGKAQTLPYQGMTVTIEKGKDGKYSFKMGTKELTGADAKLLDSEFNKDKTGDSAMRKLLLPAKPVRVGESWKVDGEQLAKELMKGEAPFKIETAKVTAGGKLVEVYTKDGAKFGKMDFTVDLPLQEIGDGKDKLVLQPGARLSMTFNMDVCIDGSMQTGTIKGTVNLSGMSNVPAADGTQNKLVLSSKITGQEQRKEVPRK